MRRLHLSLPVGLDIPAADRDALADCVQRAITARERRVRLPASPLTADDMLRVPYLLGWVAVEAVRHSDLSPETQRQVVGLALLRANPAQNGGIPYGLAVLASFLAGRGELDLASFTEMMKLAEVARAVVDGARPDELRVLSDWLNAQPGLDDSQRLWWLWFLSVHCDDHRIGQPWLEALLDHPTLSNDLKRSLCLAWLSPRPPGHPPPAWRGLDQALTGQPATDDEAEEDEDDNDLTSLRVVSHLMRQALGGYMFVPRYLERLAMTGLVRAGDEPLAVCQKYLGAQRPTPTEALNQGVADVLRAYHRQMAPDEVHAIIERGLALPQVTTRKAFYALAADLYGPAFWRRAQQDSAASIRNWAARQATKGV